MQRRHPDTDLLEPRPANGAATSGSPVPGWPSGVTPAGTPGTPGWLRAQRTRRFLGLADLLAAAVALAVIVGPADLLWPSVLIPLLWVFTNKVVGLYDRDGVVMRRSTLDEVPRLAEISGLFALLTWLFADHFTDRELHRMDVLGIWLLVFVLATGARAAARSLARRLNAPERCAIVGDAPAIGRVQEKLEESRISAEVVATYKIGPGHAEHPPSDEQLAHWLVEQRVERLIIAPLQAAVVESPGYVRLAKAAGVRVSVLPRLFESIGSSVDFEELDGMTVLGLRSSGLSRSSRWLKRGMDLAGAGAGLLLVSPLMLGLAVAIRLGSDGPVVFRQRRVGKDGELFTMLKFRTMVDGADAMKEDLRAAAGPGEELFKLERDPRVTRVGRLLRATSLDELPQLINVVRGEMSLVGPRPLIVEEDALIRGLDRSRLHLTPGMTGPWQILGGQRVPLREMVSMDYLYVANWSLWRDVEILVRTVAHMVRGSGR